MIDASRLAVTIVVPSYKNADRVGKAIRSALDQPDVDATVIVVIDDLCENTRRLAAGFGERVRTIVNDRNRGAPFSRNAGLALTTTPFVMFLDSDDYVEGRLLAGICEEMQVTGATVGFGPAISHQDTTGDRHFYRRPASSVETLFEDWMEGPFCVPSCSVVWNTAFLRKVGGWDEELRRNQDGELLMRALLKGATTCLAEIRPSAGIYVKHDGDHRITRLQDHASSIHAIETLLATPSIVIPEQTVRRSSALRLYEIARLAFQGDDRAVGERALKMSRDLGFSGHRGSKASRVLGRLVGLRNLQRLRSLIG